MELVLHVGAHRTASTSFQAYLKQNRDELGQWGIGFWGPHRTRKGLFAGVVPRNGYGLQEDQLRRAKGRISMQLARTEMQGARTLIVSDENMLGSVRDNLRRASLYAQAGDRMGRFSTAFGGQVSTVMISIRSLDHYWASAAAYGVGRGHPMPAPDLWERIAVSMRGWRDVITDVAQAFPDAQVRVLPFEFFSGRPELKLRYGAGCYAPAPVSREWLNAAPRLEVLRQTLAERGDLGAGWLPEGYGPWSPFTAAQTAALRELYADDMHWLVAGADGLATLIEDPDRNELGVTRRLVRKRKTTRGHAYAIEDRAMAQHC